MRKKLKRILLIFIIALVSLILAASAYLYVNKNELSKQLLLSVNTYTTGELQIRDLAINPFVNFPNIAITLNEPRYFETKQHHPDSLSTPILHLDKLHISFDILELLDSRIKIIGLFMEDGNINVVREMDSTFNIVNAFQPAAQDQLPEQAAEVDSLEKTEDISLSISQLGMKNVAISMDLKPSNQKEIFTVSRLKSSLKYLADSIACDLDTDLEIKRIGISDKLSVEDEELKTKIKFFFDRRDNQITIDRGDIEFRNAQFYTSGVIDFDDDGQINMNFEANDQKLQFTKLFLTTKGINNLKKGQLFLHGNIRGSMSDPLPVIECYFGANELTVEIPKSSERLENLIVDGYFNLGDNPDLSLATIQIDTVTALLNTGYINANALIKNLKTPEIKYSLDASLRLDNLNEVFALGPIQDLSGRLTIRDQYHGQIQSNGEWIDIGPDPFYLKMDSISCDIEGVMPVDQLHGSVSGTIDTLQLRDIQIVTGSTDLQLDASIHDLSNLLYSKSDMVRADVSLSSAMYNFPEFFSFLPDVAEAFPYRISEVSVEVRLETTFAKLTEFKRTPEVHFAIHKAEATIESFLPHAILENGTFKMFEADSTSVLDFDGFDIQIAGATATADYSLFNKKDAPDSMNINLVAKRLNPAKILFDYGSDTIPEIVDAEIDGSFHCEIVLPEDPLLLFRSLDFQANEFDFVGVDTIYAGRLVLNAEQIGYESNSAQNPLATLSASSVFHAEDVKTTLFQTDDIDLQIEIDTGKYTFIVTESRQFGFREEGFLEIEPFAEPPKYHLDYEIGGLAIEEFMTSFYNEEIFEGLIDMDLELISQGTSIEEITSAMSGKIVIDGDSLTLRGVNLDDVINQFQRSQSFNLVDAGAFMVAGPAGILYTKGSDYAVMMVSNKGDSTQISKISSKWSLDNGNIRIEDVAVATLENRVAAKGWLDMRSDSLDITIGIVDAKGCSVIDQRIYGSSAEPEYSKVKVIKTLLSPVTNLIDDIISRDCEVFYEGVVQQPQTKAKKSK